MPPLGALPSQASFPRQSRDVIIQIDVPSLHEQSLPYATPGHPNAGPSVPTSSDHAVVQIEDDHRPSLHVDAQPTFTEALFARMEGAAPVQAVQAATDVVCSVLEAVAMGGSLGAAATQSVLQSGLHLFLDSAFHIGITSAMETEKLQTLTERFKSENETKEDALNRIRAFSAVLSMASGTAVNMVLSEAAAAILNQPLGGAGIGLALVNGLVATGVLSAGALVLYKTRPAFRAQIDAQLENLFGSVKTQAESSVETQDPPSFAQADAMELGQAVQMGPLHGVAPAGPSGQQTQ